MKFKTAFGETESLLVRPDGLYDPSAYKAAETDADRNAAKVGTFDGDFNAVPVAGKEAYFADPQGGPARFQVSVRRLIRPVLWRTYVVFRACPIR